MNHNINSWVPIVYDKSSSITDALLKVWKEEKYVRRGKLNNCQIIFQGHVNKINQVDDESTEFNHYIFNDNSSDKLHKLRLVSFVHSILV